MISVPRSILVSLCLAATACGPVYSTTYSFIPPENANGRACIFQCESAKTQCQHIEDLERDRCESRSDLEYERCEARNDRVYKDDDKEYCYREYCSVDYTNCDDRYRSCYQNCGGKVNATTVCTAFCDQAK